MININAISSFTELQIYVTVGYTFIITFTLFLVFSTLFTFIKTKRLSQLAYALSHMFALVWIVTVFLAIPLKDLIVLDITLLNRLSFAASGLSVVFLSLYLFSEFITLNKFAKRFVYLFYTSTGIFNTAISLIPGLVVVEYVTAESRSIYGPLRNVFAFILILSWLLPLILLGLYYPKSKGVQRFQLRLLIPGLFVTIGLLVLSNLILPSVLNSSYVSLFGPLLISLYYVILFYTSFKYRLITIPNLLQISLNALLKIGYVLPIYFFLNNLNNQPFSIAFLIIVAAFSGQVVKGIDTITQTLDPTKERYKNLEIFLNKISKELNLIKLCSNIEEYTGLIFPNHSIYLIIIDTKDKDILYSTKKFRTYNPIIDLFDLWTVTDDHKLITYEEINKLALESIPGSQERKVYVEIEHFMTVNKIGVIVPLNKKVIINGVLLISRENETIYTEGDLQIAETIANNCSVAISRALLYKDTRDFAAQLEKTVSHRTLELKHANEKLGALVTELETLNNAKSEFISIASHQLRTPISIIRGYMAMLIDGDFGKMSAEQLVILEKAQQSVRQLVNIVEDILNASRIEQGRLVVTYEKVDMIELIEQITSELEQKAQRKNLTVAFDNKIKTLVIDADRNKIFEVVMNLVDNALNYTIKGGVTVKAFDMGKAIRISVKDTGIGIPKDSEAKIFQRFSRLENAKKVRPDGTGIGLYIARTIVEAHHGKIWFESVEDKGTTFFVEIPKEKPDDMTMAEPPKVEQSGSLIELPKTASSAA